VSLLTIGLLLGGLVALILGGNWFVDGASGLARIFRVRPFIIGVVVIGFGTSAPEMLVSIFAVIDGKGGIAVGNIIGSNIANIGLVLSVAALVRSLHVQNAVLRKELPLTALVTLIFGVLVMIDGRLDIFDGIVLLAVFGVIIAYILGLFSLSGSLNLPRRELDREAAEMIIESPTLTRPKKLLPAISATIGGLAFILLGAQLTVDNASAIARELGVSNAVIGLTLVAVGTSLPELVSAVIAAWKGETELIVGNVLGSNLYNLGFIGGTIGLFSGAGLQVEDQLRYGSVLLMSVLTLLLIPVLYRGSRMDRIEGALLLVGYAVYSVMLF
jgi:cation:H+ antiporter